MQLKIDLGVYKNPFGRVQVPFWFPGDKSFHLNKANPSIVLELDGKDLSLLKQIEAGYRTGEIELNDKTILEKAIAKAANEKLKDISKLVDDTKFKTPDQLKEIKRLEFENKAKELIALSVAKLRAQVGEASAIEGVISDGIFDIELLEKMEEIEKALKMPRTTALDILKKRINILKEKEYVKQDLDVELHQNTSGKIVEMTEEEKAAEIVEEEEIED